MNISRIMGSMLASRLQVPAEENTEFEYKAFLSYSHVDGQFADNLHRELESYVVPRSLKSALHLNNRRLYRIFKDQSEIPASSDLGVNLKNALEKSSALIVVCSPAAAKSKWMDAEIRYFRSLPESRLGKRRDRIFCVLAEGDLPDCYPESIREDLVEEAAELEKRHPAAADMRCSELQGKARRAKLREQKLRLISGLISVSPEDLLRRDREQLLRRRRKIAAVSSVIVLLTLAALIFQRYRYEEGVRLAKARTFFDKGRREFESGEPLRALPYLGAAYEEGEKSRDLRLLLSRAMAPLDARRLTIPPLPSRLANAGYSPDGKHILQILGDGSTVLRDVADGKVQWNLKLGGDSAAFSFSPDSHSLGIADGGTVKVLEVVSGHLRATLSGHELDVKTVDFSPDGRLVVTASVDNTARIWNAESGGLIHILQGHSASVLWAGFSPDGRKVLTVSNDHTARIWDEMTGKMLTEVRAERGLSSGHFSPDGQRILVLGNMLFGRNYAALYGIEGRLLAEWKKKAILAAEFDPDGKDVRIVTAEDNGKSLEVRDLIGGDALYTLKADTELVGGVRFSKDRKHLLTVGFDRIPKVWNASTGELEGVFIISPGKDPISRGASFGDFSPMGGEILVTTDDGEFTVWNLNRDRQVLEDQVVGLSFVSYNSTGSLLFSADRRALSIWNHQGKLVKKIEPPEGIIRVFVDSSGSRILTVSSDNKGYLWSVPDGLPVALVQGRAQDIASADFSSDGKLLVTIGPDDVVNFWDAVSGHRINSLLSHSAKLMSVQLNSEGNRILLTSRDGSVALWDVGNARRLCLLVPPGAEAFKLSSARFSPDGRFIVTGGDRPKIWGASCNTLAELPGSVDASIGEFSRDGSRFVTFGFGEPIRIWSTFDGKLKATLQRNSILPGSAHFSPDGQWLLTAGVNRADLWNAGTGSFITSFGGKSQVGYATFSPQGDTIVTASADGRLEVWELRVETRSPEKISRLINALSPWRLKGGSLYQVERWSLASQKH